MTPASSSCCFILALEDFPNDSETDGPNSYLIKTSPFSYSPSMSINLVLVSMILPVSSGFEVLGKNANAT